MSSVLPETLAQGRFQLIEIIGEGGMATVWRAFDQRLQRPRAVKLLSPAYAQRPSLRRRFLAEAQTMATLEEARVVRVFDMGEDGDQVYIVMELVEGGSLLDRVRDHGKLPPRMASQVVIEIAEALQAAHDHKVIHRDIKPHNILLTRSGDVRITDFGIAQVKQDDGDGFTKTGAMMGTWGYMSPEQKSNAKSVDVRADVYALGATLWALIRDDTPPELFMSDQEAEMLAELPQPLADVIQKATRYRREERYGTAKELATALRDVMPQLPEDPPDTPPLMVIKPAKVAESARGDTMMQFDEVGQGTMVPPAEVAAALAASPSATMPPMLEPPPPAPPETRPSAPIEGTIDVQIGTPLTARPARSNVLPVAMVGLVGAGTLLLILVGVGFLLWPRPKPVDVPAPVPVTMEVPSQPQPVQPEVAPAQPVVTPEPVKEPQRPEGKASKVEAPQPEPARIEPVVAPTPEVAPVAEPAAPKEVIAHANPGGTSVGSTVTFTAKVSAGYTPTLYYRPKGSGAYQNKTMQGGGGDWKASLKVDESMAAGIDYFIQARAADGKIEKKGSAGSPMVVAVN